jgi:hypothetical protein
LAVIAIIGLLASMIHDMYSWKTLKLLQY